MALSYAYLPRYLDTPAQLLSVVDGVVAARLDMRWATSIARSCREEADDPKLQFIREMNLRWAGEAEAAIAAHAAALTPAAEAAHQKAAA